MAYNLTQRQKDILKWLVDKSRSGSLSEEFLVGFTLQETFIAGNGTATIEPPQLVKSDLLIFSRFELISLDEKPSGSCLCSLLQAAYDAVDRDFTEPPQSSGAQIIGNIVHNMYGGNMQGVGSATGSQISQNVNDPAEFLGAIDNVLNKLVEIVEKELDARDRQSYIIELNRLKDELHADQPDHSLIRKILGTLSFTADISGNYDLMMKVLPALTQIAAILSAHFGV